MKVKRSCNADRVIDEDGLTAEEALEASWDYFERTKGIPNPKKRLERTIQPLRPKPRKDT